MDLFYTLSQFYKNKFGFKVQKIPLTLASTCPNRLGLRNMQTCVFCDQWGSSAYPEQQNQTITEQIESKIGILGHHRSAENFLAYFQTYTTTFVGTKKLKAAFDQALKFNQIKGLIIGTRPDCFSDAVFDLINEFKEKTYVAVELGVESFFDHHLNFLKRGHDSKIIYKTIKAIQEKTKIDIGLHLIFGLPNETDGELIETAKIVSSLNIQHVKLHNLHVLKNTELEQMYLNNSFKVVELEEYTRRVILFLEHLSPTVSIERLSALSSRWEELVAPEWTKTKLMVREHIMAQMRKNNIYQGKNLLSLNR
ncbi:MAG: TIGR01212 family radical SAM protein [Oligoflexia bacterium]|nr:TIGR01212 family radical SAM protein [Oligoflexia bacterium]